MWNLFFIDAQLIFHINYLLISIHLKYLFNKVFSLLPVFIINLFINKIFHNLFIYLSIFFCTLGHFNQQITLLMSYLTIIHSIFTYLSPRWLLFSIYPNYCFFLADNHIWMMLFFFFSFIRKVKTETDSLFFLFFFQTKYSCHFTFISHFLFLTPTNHSGITPTHGSFSFPFFQTSDNTIYFYLP